MRHATFRRNPQFRVEVKATNARELVQLRALASAGPSMPLQVVLVRGDGERLSHFALRDLVASSGAYTCGIALCDVSAMQPGVYTLVVSAYDPSHTGPFQLSVESSAALWLSPIPAEGAGMYHRRLTRRVGDDSAHWNLTVGRDTLIYAYAAVEGAPPEPVPLSFFIKAGPETIARAGDATSALASCTARLAQGAYTLSVQKDTALPGVAAVCVDLYSDQPLCIG